MTHTILTGTGNILKSAGEYTVRLGNSTIDFHGNHILKGTQGVVEVFYYNIPDLGLDFSGNWWGTTNADSIAAWIHDGEDDPELQAVVRFDPFAMTPIPAEKKSTGDLKRMFR